MDPSPLPIPPDPPPAARRIAVVRATPRECVRVGFFASLGAVLMALLALAAWRLGEAALAVVGPFVVAGALALLLDPVADRLERRGLSRMAAVGAVFGLFLLVVAGVSVLAVPALIAQASRLAENGPHYVGSLRGGVNEWLAHHRRIASYRLPPNFDSIVAQLSDRTSAFLRTSSGSLTGVLLDLAARVLDLLVTLIITFYLLLDIDRLRARFFYLLPDAVRAPAERMAGRVGGVFSDYLRGLMIVCGLYGIGTFLLLCGLSLVHIDVARYALLVGAAAGVLYAVPYVGALMTVLVTFLVAFAAGGAAFGGVAAGLLLVLNQVFDNVISPRVVGGGVGLHPVVAVFSLTLGARLFGLPGMLLSVPVAGSVRVVLLQLFPKLAKSTPRSVLQAHGVESEEASPAG